MNVVYLCLFFCFFEYVSSEEILKSSLTFVIDDTGSMSDDINEVKEGSNAIFDTVMKSNGSQIEDFVLVTFNDPTVAYRVTTKDRDTFKRHLESITVWGGGDCPENAMTGIELALGKSRLGSYLYVFTDAAAKDYSLYSRVKSLAQRKQSQVVFVLTGTCGFNPDDSRAPDYQVYYDLAKATSGQVFHLGKDEIDQILVGVVELIKKRKTTLASETFPPGYGHKFSFDVDSKEEDVVVSVSGKNPELNVKGPDGSAAKTKDLMATSRVSIVKILDTKPGVHEAVVGSKTETNVVVTAGTSINFRHGFSTFKPSSIYDTASTPLPDKKSFLSIKLTGEGVKLITVIIRDLDKHIIRNESLEIVDEKDQFYKTLEPFDPPKDMFIIEIVGTDTEGRPISRTSATPIEVQKSDVVMPKYTAPTVTINDAPKVKAEYDEPLELKCKVNAYPQPEITWEDIDTGAVLSTVVTVIELPNDFINILHIEKVNKNATYKCTAKNILGQKDQIIAVETKRKIYFNVLEEPKDTTIEYNTDGILTCRVDSYPLASTVWYINAKQIFEDENLHLNEDSSILTIKSMQPNLAGTFICEVKNEFNRKILSANVKISGVERPKIDKSNTEVFVIKGVDTSIDCKVTEGKPTPIVNWYFKQEKEDFFRDVGESEDGIKMKDVDSNVAGIFKCEATNVMGKDVHEIHFVVEYAPVIDESEKEIRVTKNEELNMNCDVDGNPIPSVTWFKDGVVISNLTKYSINKDHSFQLNAKFDDSGNYICEAKNKHGVAVKHVNVKVQALPKIEKRVNNIHLIKGSSATIRCKIIEGKPKPTMNWYLKRLDDRRFRKIPRASTEFIELKHVDTSDSGTYRCEASNLLGRDIHEIDVLVEYPPVIYEHETTILDRVGARVTMRCDVLGEPNPAVTWYKNGALLTDTKTLRMHRDYSISLKLAISDEGTYTCSATNKLGTANSTITVTPYEPVTIAPPKSNYSFTAGSYVNLPCEAEGYPKPDVKWTFYRLDLKAHPETIMLSIGTAVVLPRVQLNEQGYYTCVATNFASAHNITYDVKVYAPPIIEKDHTENLFQAVAGDLVLRVPCKVTGNPEPLITWQIDGYNIASDSEWFDIDEDGTLIIKNVDAESSGRYVCSAENYLGSDSDNFEVLVEPYPKVGKASSTIRIEEGKSAAVECAAPNERTDELRWYKGKELVAYNHLKLNNVTKGDAGTYTCRVSNFHDAHNGYTEVKIGYKPKFISEEEKNIDLAEGTFAYLVCDADSDPAPEVTWFHDGKKIELANYMIHTFEMKMKDKGRYECEVSNVFGKINRVFEIEPKGCHVDVEKDMIDNQPLMLSSSLKWLEHDTTDGFLHIPMNEYISLSCPSQFTKISQPHIMALCEKEDIFRIGDQSYKYSDLKCREEIKPIVEKTGTECLPGNNERIRVYYDVRGIKHDIYEMCLDKDMNIPIFAKHKMHHSLADVDTKISKPRESESLALDFGALYDCELQINTISSLLGRWFHNDDGCCFAKRPLINPRDVFPGLPQRATVNDLITVPQWSSCNSKNWDELERRVRLLAKSVSHELLVWTGTAQQLRLRNLAGASREVYLSDRESNRQAVPLYLWKVIQDPATSASLAVIQVNVPDLKLSEAYKHLLCKDICRRIKWMTGPFWRDLTGGYTYCCSLEDFERAFGYVGLFDNHKEILYELSPISRHYT